MNNVNQASSIEQLSPSKVKPVTTDKHNRPEPEKVLHDFSDVLQEIASKLIPKFHPELASANFIYKCRNISTKSSGIPVAGCVKKASPNERLLSRGKFAELDDEADFIIEIALDVFNPMSLLQRTALIDHLLTRCVAIEDEKSGDMKYKVRSPQVQEFPEIAERHGKWNDGLNELIDCLNSK